jgi:tRNA (cmo5U34)-methyltransferase
VLKERVAERFGTPTGVRRVLSGGGESLPKLRPGVSARGFSWAIMRASRGSPRIYARFSEEPTSELRSSVVLFRERVRCDGRFTATGRRSSLRFAARRAVVSPESMPLAVAKARLGRATATATATATDVVNTVRWTRSSADRLRRMAETHSVKRHLDVDAGAYDVEIRRFIPHYDDMLATAVELLAALAAPTARVLDLGGGTGALSAAVLAGMPQARVTVLDVDAAMLAESRRRLAGFGDRVQFHEASFLDPLPAVDAVVASLALHHVHDLERKTKLYRDIDAALTPGGVFLNLDAAVSEEPRINALTFDRMAAHMQEHGITDSEARRHFAAWAGEDRYFPLAAELGALRRAGFAEVECFWRRGNCAICCGLRGR